MTLKNVEFTLINNCAKFRLICVNNKKVSVGGRVRRTPPPVPQVRVLKKAQG